MRKLWIIPVILLLLTLGSTVTLLWAPGALAAGLQWAAFTFTHFRLELEGLTLEPRKMQLKFDALHLYPDQAAGRALLTVLRFDARTRLGDLWRRDFEHTAVNAGSVVVYVSADDEAADPTPVQWMQYLTYLPAKLDIETVHVVNQKGSVSIFPLRNIKGRRSASQLFELSLLADLDGAPLNVTLNLAGTDIQSDRGSINFTAVVEMPESASRSTLQGMFTGQRDTFRYDMSIDAQFTQVETFMSLFPDPPPLAGALSLQGKLQGNHEGFTLSDAAFELDNRPAYFFKASGGMASQRNPDPNLSLIASGELDSAKYFLRWLSVDLAPLGGIRASIALSGTLANPVLDQLTVVTTSSEGLWIALNGSSGPGSLGSTRLPPDIDFTLYAQAPSLRVLSPWLGQAPSIDPGPWKLSTKISENDGALRLSTIDAELGRAEGTQLSLQGEIAQLALTTSASEDIASGIDLAVTASSLDLQQAGRWFDVELPPGFALQASGQLTGKGTEVALSAGAASVTHNDLSITLSDAKTQFTKANGYQPKALQAKLQATAQEAAALGQFTDLALPQLGALKVDANVEYAGQQAHLTEIRATLNSTAVELIVTGGLQDISGKRAANLAATMTRANLDALLAQAVPVIQQGGKLGNISGGFALRGEQNNFDLSGLELASETGAPLTLKATGAAQYRGEDWGAAVTLDYASDDLELLQTLTGLALQPTAGSAQLSADANAVQLANTTRLGNTEIELVLQARHRRGVLNGLTAALSAPVAHLADLGLQASDTQETDYRPAHQLNKETGDTSLPRLLESLPRYPIDLRITLGSLQGEATRFDNINVHLTGSGTTYLLEQFDFNYDGAPAEIRGIVDVSLDPPGVSIAGQAQAIPLNTLSRDLGIDTDISGSLNLRGGISAQGATGKDILGQLDGSVAFALENATVEGAAYDVLATGILTWLFSGAALEKSTYIDCTMAQFALNDGVARTEDLFVESPNMIATGVGTFNFPERTLALTLTPRSKSRSIQFPSSISLRGDMASPRTSVSAIAATLDISAEAMLFVPKLLLKVFGGGRSKESARRPCQTLLQQ